MQVYLEPYGCQMNEYDSELVRSILRENRFEVVAAPEDADVVLLNTCAIREHAHQKVYGRVRALGQLRRRNPDLRIGILGCMAQNLKDALLRQGSGVDLVEVYVTVTDPQGEPVKGLTADEFSALMADARSQAIAQAVKDGTLTKYEFKVKGKMSFNGNDIDQDRTTTVVIKDVGTTKVTVPEEAKKKLS